MTCRPPEDGPDKTICSRLTRPLPVAGGRSVDYQDTHDKCELRKPGGSPKEGGSALTIPSRGCTPQRHLDTEPGIEDAKEVETKRLQETSMEEEKGKGA